MEQTTPLTRLNIECSTNASFGEAVTGALLSLRGSKLRSFLTLLGIILATTTLIAVMSVIDGMNVYVAQNVSSMGADGFKVRRIVMMGVWDPKKYLEMDRRNPAAFPRGVRFSARQLQTDQRNRHDGQPHGFRAFRQGAPRSSPAYRRHGQRGRAHRYRARGRPLHQRLEDKQRALKSP